MSTRWYLAGPMTGVPYFNFPLFRSEAARLRFMGYEIINPAELDSPAVQEAAMRSTDGRLIDGKIAGETWGDILARDVRIVANECDGVFVLPGWSQSRGARLETFVAHLCDLPILWARDETPVYLEELLLAWEGNPKDMWRTA